MKTSALERFVRYVTVDTRADESSSSTPSTPGQLVLMELLAAELRALGLVDVVVDGHGYLMATRPGHARRCMTGRSSASSRTSTRRRN